MSPLHALCEDEQLVFSDIHQHFQLNQETLTKLTTAFVDEIRLGLGSYNQAMAMVYVLHTIWILSLIRQLVLHSSQAFLMVQRRGG